MLLQSFMPKDTFFPSSEVSDRRKWLQKFLSNTSFTLILCRHGSVKAHQNALRNNLQSKI